VNDRERSKRAGPRADARIRWAGSLLLPVALALGVTLLLLVLVGAPPVEALRLLWQGATGSPSKLADTVMAWVPLVEATPWRFQGPMIR